MSPHVNLSYENGFDLHENELSGKQIFCHMNGFTQRLPEDNSKIIIIIIISIYIALNRLILHSALQCLLYD